MKICLITTIFISLNLFISCSSGNITNEAVLNGFWITDETPAEYNYDDVMYSALSFKIDSFFLEVGRIRYDNAPGNPFRAKGIYQINGEYLILKGIVRHESTNKFREGYSQTFEYRFSGNILIIQSVNNRYSPRFTLRKMSKNPKTF